MKKILSLVLLAATLQADARLGDTPDESTTRYGKPAYTATKNNITSHSYKVAPLTISCRYKNNICIQISYANYDGPIAQDIIDALLNKNRDQEEWQKGRTTTRNTEAGTVYETPYTCGKYFSAVFRRCGTYHGLIIKATKTENEDKATKQKALLDKL